MMDLATAMNQVERAEPMREHGRLIRVVGLVIESTGPEAAVGELCRIGPVPGQGAPSILAEVVGFREDRLLLMPIGEVPGLRPGWEVVATGRGLTVPVGHELLGRVVDGLGRPLDGGPPIRATARVPLHSSPPDAMTRRRITDPFATGVRVIDGLLTAGEGQRMGIFAGSGVGKSVLLGMIAQHAAAEVNVIALVGERGREVREFIERDLGPGLARSVVVVATSDQPPLLRLKAAFAAASIADHFRGDGRRVLLLMDSVTRLAMAQREVGLAAGEPPATRGYPPSTFALLPRLFERAGNSEKGSITGFFTILVEGDDLDEPISDAVRSVLDGHLVLSRSLAARNHYPALDPLESVSRVMADVVSRTDRAAATDILTMLARHREAYDLIQIGAYQRGSDPETDLAIEMRSDLDRFLRQERDTAADFDATWASARALGSRASAGIGVQAVNGDFDPELKEAA
jgi:FliI/YscN family ATPase